MLYMPYVFSHSTDKMLFKEKSLEKSILKQREYAVLMHSAFYFVQQADKTYVFPIIQGIVCLL